MWYCHCFYGRQFNHTYTCTVTHCDIATVYMVATKITLTRVTVTHGDISTVVKVANKITLKRVPWHSVTLPHFYGRKFNYTYTCIVTHCDIATFVTVANTITLTSVPWHSVTFTFLLRSPIHLHIHVYRNEVWYCHCCYDRQYNYTYTWTVTQCDFANFVTVANKITPTRVLRSSAILSLLLGRQYN